MSIVHGKSRWGILVGLAAAGTLMAVPAHAANITLQATLRDFCGIGYVGCGSVSVHPDFERPNVVGVDDRGVVNTTLGAGGVPTLINPGGSTTITSGATFAQWYTNDPQYNQTLVTPFTFTDIGGGLFQYDNQNYFPLDGLLINDRPSTSQCDYVGNPTGCNHNFGFTTQVHTTFTYQTGQQFTFDGDDDAWVFINNQLVIDLGGVHQRETQTVDLDNLNLVVGNVYSLDFFGAERHTVESHVRITTSFQLDPGTPVPEPTSMVILGSGLLFGARFRRKAKKN